jgi:hypothetical protein
MTKDEAPIKGEGMISDPDEYDWKCGCALCEVRYKNWKSDYDVQQAALRNEALDRKAENARELGLDYEPDYKVTVVDDQHPKGVPLEQWGRSAPVRGPVGVFMEDDDIGHVRLIPHQQMKLKDGDKLYATPPAQPAPVQEPVATLWQHGETGRTRITMPGDITDCDARWFKAADLYTTRPAAPVQEPVAWLTTEVTTGTQVWLYEKTAARYQNPPTPLYTTPPAAQRTWVGLTDEQKETLSQDAEGNPWSAVELAEAKLKELNA